MLANLSKEVTDRVRSCRFVLASFVKEGAEVAAIVQDKLRPAGSSELREAEGEAPSQVPLFADPLAAVAQTIRWVMDRMISMDRDLYAALAWEGSLRQKRESLTKKLAGLIVGLRSTLSGQYPHADMMGLGLQRLVARDTTTILRRAETVIQQARAPNLTEMLGDPRFENASDYLELVGEIPEVMNELLQVVEDFEASKRDTEAVREKKQGAMDEYDRYFLRGTRIYEDLCRFAGKDKLANRVRPSEQRPGVTEEEPDDVSDEDIEAADESPAEGPPPAAEANVAIEAASSQAP